MSRFERGRDLLWPRGPRPDVWAVIDCARDPRLYSAMQSSHNLNACLYSGDLAPALERVAPHLVQLEYDDKVLTQKLFDGVWGDSWGIVLRCDTSMDRLRKHLRRLLVAEDHKGRRLVFRYYDPRVLRVYLPTCMSGELEEMFGPIDRLWAESELIAPDALRLMEFSRSAGRLTTVRIDLPAAQAQVNPQPVDAA